MLASILVRVRVRTQKGTGDDMGTGRPRKKPGDPKGKYTMTKNALAQRQKNFSIRPAETDEEYDLNARSIDHIMKIYQISQRVDKKDPVSIKSAFAAYVQLCQENGFPPSNMAAYTAIRTNKMELDRWMQSDNEEYREIAQMVHDICSISREQQITAGSLHPVIGIFWQRNYDGLRNDTEQQQNMLAENQDDSVKTASDYKKQYGKLLEE